MARASKKQAETGNKDLDSRRRSNTPKQTKNQINEIKLNDFGMPVLPENRPGAENAKMAMSNSHVKGNGVKAFVENPTRFKIGRGSRGMIQKTEGIPYPILRKIARNFILHGMVMRLRASQIRKFSFRSEAKDKPGFKVKMRDLRRAPTKVEQKLIDECEQWLFQTGRRDFEGATMRKDKLPQMSDKMVRDLLTIDRIATSLRFDRTGEIVDFASIDGATIIPVNPYDGFDGDRSIEYVQEINGQVVEKFHHGELIVDWMYKTSEIDHQYFGWTAIEESFKEIMSTINALKYNSGNFTTNRTPKGFFSTAEEVDQQVLNDLEERFAALFNGADSAWRSPFFAGVQDLRWNPIQQSNRDMEFSGYMNMLFSLYLAVQGVDPAELGLRFNESASLINNSGGQAAQSDRSRERGVVDILEFKARHLTEILERTKKYKDLEVSHTGLEIVDKTVELQNIQQQQSTLYSTDQLRALRDEEPLWKQAKEMGIDDEEILSQIKLIGALPTSPTAMSVLQNILMQKAQEKQMQQQQAMQGGEGGEGAPPGGGEQPEEGGDEEGGEGFDESELPDYEEGGDEDGGNEGHIELQAKEAPKELSKSRKFIIEL